MMTVLLQAAGFALAGAAGLSAIALAFDRIAPRDMLRERHDLVLAVFATIPFILVAALLPRPDNAPTGIPVLIEHPSATANAAAPSPAKTREVLPELPAEEGLAGLPGLSFALETYAPLLIALWVAGVLVMLARLGFDLVALKRLKTRARRRALPAGFDLSRDVPVAESEAVASPMVAGFLAPLILVPRGFALDAGARPVLEHEIAHTERRDTWIALAIRVVMAVFWWALPLRFLLPMLDRSREALCDRQAARVTGAPRDLAIALLDTAAAAVKTPSLALAAAPTRSELAQRISHLTAPRALNRKDSAMRLSLILPVLAAGSLIMTPGVEATGEADPAPERRLDEALDREASLFQAARRGRTDRVAELLDAGAVADTRFSGDGTALTAAVRNGHRAAAELLLASGADPDLGISGDGNPLIAAAARGDREMVDLLLTYGARTDAAFSGDGNALIAASRAGHADIARRLIAAGADPNGYVRGDETPLVNAAQSGQIGVAEVLVEAGADVSLTVLANIRDGRDTYRSPLSEARRNGHRDMVRWLEARGATHNPPSE